MIEHAERFLLSHLHDIVYIQYQTRKYLKAKKFYYISGDISSSYKMFNPKEHFEKMNSVLNEDVECIAN